MKLYLKEVVKWTMVHLSRMNSLKDKYFILSLEALVEGHSIESLENHLKYYESTEEYIKCAGIKKAIDYSKHKTTAEILLELERIEDAIK